MSRRRQSQRLGTPTPGPSMTPGIKVPADSSHGDDGQAPSEYARVTRSASKRSVQHREDGLPAEGARGRAWSEEALNELVAKSEWEEYDDVKSLTGEEKELGNRAMIKLDEFADREWPRNASPITTHGTSPADSSVPPRGSSRQAQEPPVGQTGQSSVGQHDPNRQGSDPLSRSPGKAPNNSQQEDSSSNIIFNIEELQLRETKNRSLLSEKGGENNCHDDDSIIIASVPDTKTALGK
ncbi:predicted protein [Histoplasma capsulatum var. duboisii H88]|uniref:Predicted protein n=2 Tax=Ajellomyces capsulatus TaxID=5037 RepID=F0U6G1_AJEC8|nr:predicted protein [Histoplasma capsulatum H143]EGC42289.1 predicted protein [Histoplasma capsulatum var. duboisii H88]